MGECLGDAKENWYRNDTTGGSNGISIDSMAKGVTISQKSEGPVVRAAENLVSVWGMMTVILGAMLTS